MEDLMGNNGMRFVIAAAAVAVGMLFLVAILWFIRNRPSSPFIRGGKNRQPRLAVLDAAAIDARRRLVLVRRDTVEHLIMIGGPTDIVIETRITPQMQQPAVTVMPAPVPSTRPAVVPVAPTEPVSSAGRVLYNGEQDMPNARSTQASVERRAPDPRPATSDGGLARPSAPVANSPSRTSQPGRALSSSPAAAAPSPFPGQSISKTTPETPEDILDAARNRFLSTEQDEMIPLSQENAVSARSDPQRSGANVEFERLLDAQISGDLVSLTPVINPQDKLRAAPVFQRPAKDFASPIDSKTQRKEPTLEDEMNRMLSEMAVAPKNL